MGRGEVGRRERGQGRGLKENISESSRSGEKREKRGYRDLDSENEFEEIRMRDYEKRL